MHDMMQTMQKLQRI